MAKRGDKMIIIDRIDNGFAICEIDQNRHIDIPLNLIEGSPKEGDVLIKKGENYIIDRAKTETRRKKIISLQDDIFG